MSHPLGKVETIFQQSAFEKWVRLISTTGLYSAIWVAVVWISLLLFSTAHEVTTGMWVGFGALWLFILAIVLFSFWWRNRNNAVTIHPNGMSVQLSGKAFSLRWQAVESVQVQVIRFLFFGIPTHRKRELTLRLHNQPSILLDDALGNRIDELIARVQSHTLAERKKRAERELEHYGSMRFGQIAISPTEITIQQDTLTWEQLHAITLGARDNLMIELVPNQPKPRRRIDLRLVDDYDVLIALAQQYIPAPKPDATP
ncbi:MAG TPA: hypothetical protein PK299_11210 [Anaerolineales bacterium]|nr:hypothetical protein [Anaerolineales bacterium]